MTPRPYIKRELGCCGYQWLVFVPWFKGCWGPNTTGFALWGNSSSFTGALDDVRRYYAKRMAGTLGQILS